MNYFDRTTMEVEILVYDSYDYKDRMVEELAMYINPYIGQCGIYVDGRHGSRIQIDITKKQIPKLINTIKRYYSQYTMKTYEHNIKIEILKIE